MHDAEINGMEEINMCKAEMMDISAPLPPTHLTKCKDCGVKLHLICGMTIERVDAAGTVEEAFVCAHLDMCAANIAAFNAL